MSGSLTVCRASALGEAVRPKVSAVFMDGFDEHLTYFSKDRPRLERAFAHMFVLDRFWVAVRDETVLAIAACTPVEEPSVCLEARTLRRELGWVRGSIAAKVLTGFWQTRSYPIRVEPGWGSIEFVASGVGHRREGAARRLLTRVLDECGFDTLILEVGDGNVAAVALYLSLGFREVGRLRDKDAKHSGFDYLLYLRRDRAVRPA